MKGRTVYFIEKSVGSRASRKQLSHCLGPVTIDQARAELALFVRDPLSYKTPAEHRADSFRETERQQEEAEARKAQEQASSVIITADLIASYVKSITEGHDRKPRTEEHAKDMHRYLKEWALGPLHGRDLRKVTLPELHTALDGWKSARQKRIAALKSFTKFLRNRGLLSSAEDRTRDLISMQAREPTLKEKQAKIYTPEHMALVYRHMNRQDVRDPFLVRAFTGLHVSEIDRLAKGEGSIEPVEGDDEIAGKLTVKHKSGRWHTQAVNHQTYAALERIIARKWIPHAPAWVKCIEAAAEEASKATKKKVKRIIVADMRATLITLGRTRGRLVYAKGTQGVPLSLVAQIVGHQDEKTTKTFYDASELPPLLVVPLNFQHPDDPAS